MAAPYEQVRDRFVQAQAKLDQIRKLCLDGDHYVLVGGKRESVLLAIYNIIQS